MQTRPGPCLLQRPERPRRWLSTETGQRQHRALPSGTLPESTRRRPGALSPPHGSCLEGRGLSAPRCGARAADTRPDSTEPTQSAGPAAAWGHRHPPPRLSFCGDPPRLPFRGAIRTFTWELWESRRRPVCHPRGWNNPVTLPTRRWVPPTPPGCFRPGGGAAPTAASRRVRRAPLAPVPPMGPGRFPSSRALNDATAEAGTGSDHTA